MQRRKAVLTALLGLCSLGVLLLSSRLPDLVFRYQDRQAQTQEDFAEKESLTLTLDQASGISFAEKLRVAQQQDIQAIDLTDRQMGRTTEEVEKQASVVLNAIVGAMGYEPWWMEDTATVGVNCFAWMENSTGNSFRVWSVVWSDEKQLSYVNLILDDETGLPLSIYCEDDGLAREIAEQWKGMEGDSKAIGGVMDNYAAMVFDRYFQTIQHGMMAEGYEAGSGIEGDVYWNNFQLYFLGGEVVEQAVVEQEPEQFDANSAEQEMDGDSDSCIVTIRFLSSGYWAINC